MVSASANESANVMEACGQHAKEGSSFSFWRKVPIHRIETAGMVGVRSFRIVTYDVNIRILRSSGGSSSIAIRLTGKASHRIAGEIGIETRRDGDTLEIEVRVPSGPQRLFEWSQLELAVELPSQLWNTIHITAESGNIYATGMKAAAMSLLSGGGNIEAADLKLAEQLELRTGSGDLILDRIETVLAAVETGCGDINATDAACAVYAVTGSGNIRLERFDPAAHSEVKTGSGDVRVSLVPAADRLAIDFLSGSGSGRINEPGFVYQEQSDDSSQIIGMFGDGSVRLTVRTGSGDFELRR